MNEELKDRDFTRVARDVCKVVNTFDSCKTYEQYKVALNFNTILEKFHGSDMKSLTKFLIEAEHRCLTRLHEEGKMGENR